MGDAEHTASKATTDLAPATSDVADDKAATTSGTKRKRDSAEDTNADTVDNGDEPKRKEKKEKKQKVPLVDSDGEEITQEDILARTKKNREDRKAKRAALTSAK